VAERDRHPAIVQPDVPLFLRISSACALNLELGFEPQQRRQRRLAGRERLASRVAAVQLDQVLMGAFAH
jgi:hypothetical protein